MSLAGGEAQRILVVEDDRDLRQLICEELEDAGLKPRGVESAESAARLVEQWRPELVISDLRLPGMDGLALFQQLRALEQAPAFLVITAFGTVGQAVDALKAGVDDFLTKPLDLEHLLLTVRRLLDYRALRTQVSQYEALLDYGVFHGLIGRSEPMRRLFDALRQVARAEGPVLIIGESGTGKELVARAVHRESERAQKPFLAINCAGVPAELLESEFFGHEAGAFTGAAKRRQGLFRQADGGTLFLDEIGEMPQALQAKLLRVLQEGRVRPLGSEREVAVDVRVVAATNRSLEGLRANADFREDLFFRLETFTLQVPPLRERGDDLELLATHFLKLYATRMRRPVQGFSDLAAQRLSRYPFPGNVRELQNAVERSVTFCTGRQIQPENLPPRVRAAQVSSTRQEGLASGVDEQRESAAGVLPELLRGEEMLPTLAELESRYVRYVLDKVGGNKRRAAALLGIGRRTLYRRLDGE